MCSARCVYNSCARVLIHLCVWACVRVCVCVFLSLSVFFVLRKSLTRRPARRKKSIIFRAVASDRGVQKFSTILSRKLIWRDGYENVPCFFRSSENVKIFQNFLAINFCLARACVRRWNTYHLPLWSSLTLSPPPPLTPRQEDHPVSLENLAKIMECWNFIHTAKKTARKCQRLSIFQVLCDKKNESASCVLLLWFFFYYGTEHLILCCVYDFPLSLHVRLPLPRPHRADNPRFLHAEKILPTKNENLLFFLIPSLDWGLHLKKFRYLVIFVFLLECLVKKMEKVIMQRSARNFFVCCVNVHFFGLVRRKNEQKRHYCKFWHLKNKYEFRLDFGGRQVFKYLMIDIGDLKD